MGKKAGTHRMPGGMMMKGKMPMEGMESKAMQAKEKTMMPPPKAGKAAPKASKPMPFGGKKAPPFSKGGRGKR